MLLGLDPQFVILLSGLGISNVDLLDECLVLNLVQIDLVDVFLKLVLETVVGLLSSQELTSVGAVLHLQFLELLPDSHDVVLISGQLMVFVLDLEV